jgi:hypothetical protein
LQDQAAADPNQDGMARESESAVEEGQNDHRKADCQDRRGLFSGGE